jgi:D-alanine-D-alanine ligase
MRSAHVLVLYNEPVLPVTHPDAESEHEILFTADVLTKTLLQAGLEVSRLGASRDPSPLVAGLQANRPDVVFNLFEGTPDQGNTEAYVAGLLEWLGLPFTGSPSQALCVARNKPMTKQLLRGAGLTTPAFQTVTSLPLREVPRQWPVIVKLALEDASVGIDQGSVVTDRKGLDERVGRMLEQYGQPLLVEQFIRGREFNLSLIETGGELRVLPISEIQFVDRDPAFWPIVTYDAKWKPASRDFKSTPTHFPTDLGAELTRQLGEMAKEAFRLLDCRDYARIDFRVADDGTPYLIDVNANPCISPLAGLAAALEHAGLTHSQFILELVQAALKRKQAVPVVATAPGKGKVRVARRADREAIQAVVAGCGAFGVEQTAALLEQVLPSAERTKRGAAPCLVAVGADGGVVGVASCRKAAGSEGAFHLEVLAVLQAMQGCGVGGQLLAAVEQQVREGSGKVLLAEVSSQPGQAAARQFFQRKEFRQVGDVPDFFREGASRLTYARYMR